MRRKKTVQADAVVRVARPINDTDDAASSQILRDAIEAMVNAVEKANAQRKGKSKLRGRRLTVVFLNAAGIPLYVPSGIEDTQKLLEEIEKQFDPLLPNFQYLVVSDGLQKITVRIEFENESLQ